MVIRRQDSLIVKLEGGSCKIAWLISCPTRKALVGGVLLGATTGYMIAKKKELRLGLVTLKF